MTQLQITHEKQNALFGRKEISGSLKSEKTPSREDLLKILSEKFSVPESHIKVKNIRGKFGAKTFTIEANVYTSEKVRNEVELKKKKDTKEKKT